MALTVRFLHAGPYGARRGAGPRRDRAHLRTDEDAFHPVVAAQLREQAVASVVSGCSRPATPPMA
ncbi:hypothetical protein ACIBQX_13535 [Nonomuraea sp. NPDC049714]|uniref:hypothetical protein n=1 Tax=Nonomuraea sp. NPDC049714 TaxID=3364357 RepID=UPI0037A0757F